MSYQEMLRADWRDILEWHSLAIQALVMEPNVNGLLSSMTWASGEGRAELLDLAIKQNVMIGETAPPKDIPLHTPKEARDGLASMLGLASQALGKKGAIHGHRI